MRCLHLKLEQDSYLTVFKNFLDNKASQFRLICLDRGIKTVYDDKIPYPFVEINKSNLEALSIGVIFKFSPELEKYFLHKFPVIACRNSKETWFIIPSDERFLYDGQSEIKSYVTYRKAKSQLIENGLFNDPFKPLEVKENRRDSCLIM